MTYYIYHIPGKKIGVTCDLNNRVTVQQGYSPDEYEVLESSTDVDYISTKERKLQRERVDKQCVRASIVSNYFDFSILPLKHIQGLPNVT